MNIQNYDFKTTLHDNFGAIVLALLIILYHISKPYFKAIAKHLRVKFHKYTFPQLHIQLPTAGTANTEYIRVRSIGSSYIVINSPQLAEKIINNADNFQSATFTSQTFNFALNLLRIPDEWRKLKKFLNVFAKMRFDDLYSLPQDETADAVQKNSIEYSIHPDESSRQTNVVSLTSPNDGNTPLKLYPSLATNKSTDTETRSYHPSGQSVKFTSKMDTDMESLSEAFLEKKPLKECYYTIPEQFTLMKVQIEHSTCDTRVMNLNNTLIKKSHDSIDKSNDLELFFPLIKYCIKELIVLLEAKSNRRNTININLISYRNAVNILGVCLFGKHISQLTGSRCQFYRVCDDLMEILRHQQKTKVIQYIKDMLHPESSKHHNRRISDIVEFFNSLVNDCLNDRYEGYENSLVITLVKKFKTISPNDASPISAFLISFTINVLEILSGSTSLIISQLAKDAELQCKIRNNDKMQFNLEGIPILRWQNITKTTMTDSLIKDTFKNHPIDPVIPFVCKHPYYIPETKILLTPASLILIPPHVLQSSTNTDTTPALLGDLAIDLETQSFNSFVEKFIHICLKTSIVGLLQQYIFTWDDQSAEQDVASCRFTTLHNEIFVNVSRLDKRGKVIVFEESLNAFHLMKNASPWRRILSWRFPSLLSN